MTNKDIAREKSINSFNHNRKIHFEPINDVSNPRSIHGIYPYRGKISSVEARNIIEQLPKGSTLLDPFCGSGTIIYEAQKHGMKAIGVDMNPIAIDLSKAKVYIPRDDQQPLEECLDIINKAKKAFDENIFLKMPFGPDKSFHETTAKEIMSVSIFENEMSDYVKGAYYGAIALTARGCNGYKWTSSTVGKNIEPKTYINFYSKFLDKVKKHRYFNYGSEVVSIIHGDSRELSNNIPDNSIDFVFTSPPYFDALDYTAYYAKLIYEIHDINRQEIKRNLIQNVNNYEVDMRKVLDEIDRVTTDEAVIIFVVGDKKVKNEVINGGDFFSKLTEYVPTYIIERTYSGSSSQIFDTLNKTLRKEQIVVWDKSKRRIV